MKKMLKRGLSLVLTLIMVVGLLPVTAFAKVDSNTGYPQDLNNKLILSIYTTEGKFPGEPATHGSSEYVSFKSDFTRTSASGQFKASAEDELDPSILEKNVLVEGTGNSSTKVWGVFSADGLKQYFLEDASIIQPENEKKIIQEIKNCTAAEAEKYEIIWYVIKMQHSPSNWWWSSGTSEWHIDGVIKETQYVSVNYYGNGNTSGSAPDGITNHDPSEPYTVQGKNTLKKVMNGVEVAFLGWSARADGSGAEMAFYQPNDEISAEDLQKKYNGKLSLYAMWDTNTQYTATVNTYLDGVLADEADIHDGERNLYLSTDEIHYHQLTRTGEGVYTTKITGNGKFHLYNKQADGTYEQVGDRQLTIYNQNGNMDVHHYSVSYDANGGAFESVPGAQNYMYGEPVTAISDIPTKEGYRFQGWKDEKGNLIQPGEEVTASVTEPMVLTAQWEKTVNVTVNVTIDHTDKNNPNGYDRVPTKGDVTLDLVSRENGSPYLEVQDGTLKLGNSNVPEEDKVTNHTFTFNNMPGGAVEYSVVTSKPGYDVTKVEEKKDADGNWVIDVELEYRPSNFDVTFTVEVDKESVPKEYYPQAVIVKVTYWSNVGGEWKIITQQDGNKPGVRVNLDAEGKGSGSYPVWKYESNGTTPYGYRIEVTSFVYPDGTIVPASEVVAPDVAPDEAWTDNVYTAKMDPVTGGKMFGNNLAGAYIGAEAQEGTLNAVITMDLHNVTFDAQGGKVNGQESQTVEKQYKIPSFKGYVPTREGGYVFDGWYEDANGTKAAKEGVDLTEDITLYAKWIEPLTISGTVSIAGSYKQNGVDVPVNDIDRATEAVVVLQEIRNGTTYDVDSKTVTFEYKDNNAATDYGFTGIPNDGKNYQIHVLVLNYGTTYDNESDTNNAFTHNEYTAVFGDDNVADVDAHLTFVPPSYDQPMRVDATQIGAGFRPNNVLAEVMYRDTGDLHPFKRISQHNVAPFGVQIGLTNGTGTGTQSIWKWHTDGMLYDYQMNITKVNGADYDSDTAPYYITYAAPTYWNADTNAPSGGYYDESADKYTGEMKATLIPKQYLVSFDMNAGTDTVTGMENFTQTYTNEEGEVVNGYGVVHTWSYDTAIDAVPQRDGYTFTGWTASAKDVYVDGKIPATVHQEVTLTAQWEETYRVEVSAVTGGIASGTADYVSGEKATVTATANDRYKFLYWKEGAEQVSDKAIYSFSVTGNRNLVAHFAPAYQITAEAETGGTTTGTGWYTADEKVTLTATPKDSYNFIGWYENGEFVSDKAEYTLQEKVTGDRIFTAKFKQAVSFECDYVYLFGYNDSEIGATGPLLRGELAQMIYRLVKQNDRGITPGNNSYSNTDNQWFESGISYMVKVGALDESKANVPDASVTCGETYKMICLGLGFTQDTNLDYSQYAAILGNYKLPADRRVTATIKRWEFCELFNDILGRSDCVLEDADGNEITPETYNYTDLKKGDSYYEIMMIATSAFEGRTVSLEKRMERNTYDYDGE